MMSKLEFFVVLFVFKVEAVFMEGIKETSVFVSSIFEEAPKQWRLRGDQIQMLSPNHTIFIRIKRR